MKKLNFNTREVQGDLQINCPGLFDSDFFNLDQISERQKQIFDLWNKSDDPEHKDFLDFLYNTLELMRVELLKFIHCKS